MTKTTFDPRDPKYQNIKWPSDILNEVFSADNPAEQLFDTAKAIFAQAAPIALAKTDEDQYDLQELMKWSLDCAWLYESNKHRLIQGFVDNMNSDGDFQFRLSIIQWTEIVELADKLFVGMLIKYYEGYELNLELLPSQAVNDACAYVDLYEDAFYKMDKEYVQEQDRQNKYGKLRLIKK